MYLEVQI